MSTRNSQNQIEIRNILVPTDFSNASERGLGQGIAIARQFGASIDLVHVAPVTTPAELSHIGIVLLEKQMAAEAQKSLERVAGQHNDAGLPLRTHLLRGPIAASIVELAAKRKIDLIVTATHGYTGLKHAFIGSVAERIVRHAPCPVLTVHESQNPVAPLKFERILVPIDFSGHSEKAIDYAVALAKHGAGAISLLHVIEPPGYPEFCYAHVPAKERRLKDEAAEKLEALATRVSDAGIPSDFLIRVGPACDEIKIQASELAASLVVLGSHGRTGLARALFGSTAERVVRYVPTSVLVVRQHEHDFLVQKPEVSITCPH